MKDEIEDEINDFREELKNTPQEQALRAMALELMRSYPLTDVRRAYVTSILEKCKTSNGKPNQVSIWR